MKKLIILSLILIGAIISSGCTSSKEYDILGRTANYGETHEYAGNSYNSCNLYYENITVVAKNQEVISTGFGSRTAYAIASNDGVYREAVNLLIYSKLDLNQTYRVVSVDLQGCGYPDHHVVIGKVIEG